MTPTDEQRAKFEAHEKAQFKIWAEGKFKHIAEHMRWVTISIAEEGWMARAAQEGGGGEHDGYKEAAIAWAVCASIHREYAKGRDPLYTTRQADYMKAHEAARTKAMRAAQEGGAVQWACERWRAEVANRPLVNTHRRALDTTWRQVVRHFGGDDVALLGPCHDDLVSAQEGIDNG